MRTSLTVSLILLVLTIAAGVLTAHMVQDLSERYVSAAEELRILTEDGDWARAEAAVDDYLAAWKKASPWLQVLLNHEDADGVALSLGRLQLGIRAKDTDMCRDACAELREYARQVYQRDAFTLANVL